MPANDASDLTARVRALADEAAADRGLFIVDVQIRGQKGSRVIEVYADSGVGVGLDELARLSRDLDFVLETEDIVKGRYHLNVSSPGPDRSLMLPQQYPKHVGRRLKLVTDHDEEQTLAGTLAAVNDETLELEIDGERKTVRFDAVREARIELPW